MARKTAMDKKNEDIENLKIVLNDADASMAALAKQRDEARAERDQARQEIESLNQSGQIYGQAVLADSIRQRQHIRRLFNSIFILNLELARKAGYIDRVKETDENKVDLFEPEPGHIWPEQVDAAREELAGARSERMVNRVIDGMDSDVLDQVLGRTDDADFERG